MIYIGINAGYNAVSLLRKLIMTDTFVCADCGRTMPSSEAEYIDDDPICASCFEEVYPGSEYPGDVADLPQDDPFFYR